MERATDLCGAGKTECAGLPECCGSAVTVGKNIYLEQSLCLLELCVLVPLAELISAQQQCINNLNISCLSIRKKKLNCCNASGTY